MIVDAIFPGLFKHGAGGYLYVSNNVWVDSSSSLVSGDLYIIDNLGIKNIEYLSWEFFRDLIKHSTHIQSIDNTDIPIDIKAKLKLMGVL